MAGKCAKSGRPIGRNEHERWFQHWYAEGRCNTAVAEKFQRARNSVVRVCREQNWHERANGLDVTLKQQSDLQATQNAVSTLEALNKIFQREYEAYLQQKPRGDVDLILRVLSRIDDRLGVAADRTAGNTHVHVTVNTSERPESERDVLKRNLSRVFGTN